MATTAMLPLCLMHLLLFIASTIASPISNKTISFTLKGASIFTNPILTFDESTPMINMDLPHTATAIEKVPTYTLSEGIQNINVCIPIGNVDMSMCTVSFYTNTGWNFGKLFLFDHNCIMIGSNTDVDLGLLDKGFGFNSQLIHPTGVHVALSTGTMLVQYDDGFQGRGEFSSLTDVYKWFVLPNGDVVLMDTLKSSLLVWGRPDKAANWFIHADHKSLGGTWNTFIVPFYC